MKKFTMDADWIDMIDVLSEKARSELLIAIMCYHNNMKLPEMGEEARVAFACMKPHFDREIERDHSGERHWNWKGGITPENRADRNSAEYKKFRNAVLERDNYTCQRCGQVGGRLNVHHIKSFCNHKDIRFDPDNGITLCEKCHREVHKNAR